jgi:hypothetical protein
MDRPVPEAPRAATGRRRGIARGALVGALLGVATASVAAGDRLVPHAGARYVNSALGFMLDLPGSMVACQMPRERWREGVVLIVGRGGGCDAIDRAAAFITVSGEPNTEALGDVESLAASICTHPGWGEAKVGPARRNIDTLPTLSCMIQEESGSVVLEAMAQNMRRGPPATWTNLRVTLVAPGDRWPEFTRAFEDVVGRVRRLP